MFRFQGRRYFFWSRHILFWELILVGTLLAVPLLFSPVLPISYEQYAASDNGATFAEYQYQGPLYQSIAGIALRAFHWFVGAFRDDIDALSTVVIAAFTVVLAYSTIRLWRETERLARGADDHAEKMALSIAQMERAADAAEKSIKVTRDVGRAQARAYLIADDAFMFPYTSVGMPAEVYVKIKNTGKTPAKWIEIECNAQLIETRIKATDVPISTRGHIQRWAIDPGDGKDFPCGPDCAGIELHDMFKLGMSEKKTLVLQGVLRWETMFREVFESTFFFWGPVKPVLMERGNDGSLRDVPVPLMRPTVNIPTFRRIHREAGKKI